MLPFLLIAGFAFLTSPVWLPRLRDNLIIILSIFFGLTALAFVTHFVWH